MLDQFWITDIVPVTSTYEPPKVSPYFEGRMLVGHTDRMFLNKQNGGADCATVFCKARPHIPCVLTSRHRLIS